jgi:hypothetical protein
METIGRTAIQLLELIFVIIGMEKIPGALRERRDE